MINQSWFESTPTVQILGIWVLHIDGNNLPVHFSLIDHGQDTKHLHLDHLTWNEQLKNRPTENKQSEQMNHKTNSSLKETREKIFLKTMQLTFM